MAAGLAFFGAALAVAALATSWPEAVLAARTRAPRLAAVIADAARVPLRAGRDGRAPGLADRRRLLVASAACALAGGWFLGGPLLGFAASVGAPFAAARVLAGARERYRRAGDAGAPAMATALADALVGGHSVRGAIAEAALGLDGAAGAELRRAAGELALGARTEAALEAMRARAGSHGVDTIVAAALLQRGAGGDLARLLRDCARSLEDHARLEHDARAATAQARFTGLIVVLLP
ncbi:MAG: tight adherence protein, partial [Thermoleophilaceae bacterium]|nr:tight adherence protein [Thermoleophilaceae bacterium]